MATIHTNKNPADQSGVVACLTGSAVEHKSDLPNAGDYSMNAVTNARRVGDAAMRSLSPVGVFEARGGLKEKSAPLSQKQAQLDEYLSAGGKSTTAQGNKLQEAYIAHHDSSAERQARLKQISSGNERREEIINSLLDLRQATVRELCKKTSIKYENMRSHLRILLKHERIIECGTKGFAKLYEVAQ